VDLIRQTQDEVQWQNLVTSEMIAQVPQKERNFFDYLKTIAFSELILLHRVSYI
jgi:hypothetical protein